LRAGWDNDTGDRNDLQPAISRLRGPAGVYGKDGQLPITMDRLNRTYCLELQRSDVDAWHFVDRVHAGLRPDPVELDRLCQLWRGDPFKTNATVPTHIWEPLRGPLATFKAFLRTQPARVTDQITDRHRFWALWQEPTPLGRRILIVDDDVTFVESLRSLLTGYECVCAYSMPEAIAALATHVDRPFAGALVDLHLTGDTDARGIAVLDEMARTTPDLPRMLISRNPLDDSQMEAVRRYGLFDMVVKRRTSNDAAPRLRGLVEEMVSDPLRPLRTAAKVKLADLDRAIMRALAQAQRSGDDRLVADLHELYLRYSTESDELDRRIEGVGATSDDDGGRIDLDGFVLRWRNELEQLSLAVHARTL
jgi:CheY-like chemotaxis protein